MFSKSSNLFLSLLMPLFVASVFASAPQEKSNNRRADAGKSDDLTFNFDFYEGNPILEKGQKGEWDSGFIFGAYPIEYNGKIYLFYGGSSGSGAQIEIGYATSDDGRLWKKAAKNPVFKGAGAFIVNVRKDGVWEIYFEKSGEKERNKIYRATAPGPDGPWQADSAPIFETSSAWNQIIWPVSKIEANGKTHFYFQSMEADPVKREKNAQLGLVLSNDGRTWRFYNDPATTDSVYAASDPVLRKGKPGEWDEMGVSGGTVIKSKKGWSYFFVGFDRDLFARPTPEMKTLKIGYAASADGIRWTKYPTVIDTGEMQWPIIRVLERGDTYWIFYDYHFGKGIGLITGKIN